MSHHSKAQLIKFTDQQSRWESLKQFTDQMKKAKKVWESWKWTFYKGQYLKPSSVNLASVSKHVKKKKTVEFTDSTHTIYWPTTKAKKAANSWKKSFCLRTKIPSNISNVCVSWHFQNVIKNLYNRFACITDQNKKNKHLLMVAKEVSVM